MNVFKGYPAHQSAPLSQGPKDKQWVRASAKGLRTSWHSPTNSFFGELPPSWDPILTPKQEVTMETVRRSPRLENSKNAQHSGSSSKVGVQAKGGGATSKAGLQATGGVKKKRGSSNVGEKKARAYWNAELEKTLVDLLTEHNTAQYRGQNGWSSEVWNKMTLEFHQKHPYTNFTKGQVQDKEKELKREYKMIKEARQQSGVSWNEQRCMVEADDALWENLIIIGKFRTNKNFPLFDALGELYDGQLAEGNYNFTSTEPTQLDEVSHVETSVHVLDVETIHDVDDETNGGMQDAGLLGNAGNSVPMHVPAAPSTSTDNEPKKRRTNADVGILMEKYIEMKQKQIESKQADPVNANQYSIKKCLDRLSEMSFSKAEQAKAYKVFKTAENRELFLCAADMEIAAIWLQGEME